MDHNLGKFIVVREAWLGNLLRFGQIRDKTRSRVGLET